MRMVMILYGRRTKITTLTNEERTCPVCKSKENIVSTEKYNRWQKIWYMEMRCAECGSRWHSAFYKKVGDGLFGKIGKAIASICISKK